MYRSKVSGAKLTRLFDKCREGNNFGIDDTLPRFLTSMHLYKVLQEIINVPVVWQKCSSSLSCL